MPTPRRCGIAVNITVDHDALDLLRFLSPGQRTQGRFVSELIRQEMIRRETRQEMLAQAALHSEAMVTSE